MPINVAEGGSCQKVSISSTSAQSAAIAGRVVQVVVDVVCFVRAGQNPTAVSTGVDHYLAANTVYEFWVNRTDVLAFVTTAATGNAYIAVIA